MDKKGLIFLTVAVITVICTAFLVLVSDVKSDEEITITVMNSSVDEIINTMTEISVTFSETKTTVTTAITTVSSISTNLIHETAETEPVFTDSEPLYIDINSAGAEELMRLDGIGEVTAWAIINYRDENGGFRNIEEIMNVYGIGEAKFEQIRGYIYVHNPVYNYEDEIFPDYNEPETYVEEHTEPETIPENLYPIDINTAGPEILMLLPYVDEQIAQDIITLRIELGSFTNIYELLYIDKFNQKQVSELAEFVTVGQ